MLHCCLQVRTCSCMHSRVSSKCCEFKFCHRYSHATYFAQLCSIYTSTPTIVVGTPSPRRIHLCLSVSISKCSSSRASNIHTFWAPLYDLRNIATFCSLNNTCLKAHHHALLSYASQQHVLCAPTIGNSAKDSILYKLDSAADSA